MSDSKSYGGCEGPTKATVSSPPEAMDAGTYDAIMEIKGLPRGMSAEELEVHRPLLPFEELLCPGAGIAYTNPEKLLREDLSNNKVCWYADFTKDLWQFTKNANPLFALWCSHPLHPIARRERIVITIAQAFFVMMIASSIPRAKHCITAGYQTCTGDKPLLYDADNMLYANRDFCCLTEHMGLTWFLRTFSLDFGGALYALVANIVFGQVLFQAGANCCCIQSQQKWIRVTCESIGHILIVIICVLCCIPLPKFLHYTVEHHQVGFVLYTFVTGKFGAMLGTSIFQTFLWYLFWRCQCPMDAKGLVCGVNLAPTKTTNEDCNASGFHITALDYRAFLKQVKDDGGRYMQPSVAAIDA